MSFDRSKAQVPFFVVAVLATSAQEFRPAEPVHATIAIIDAFATYQVVTLGEGSHGNLEGAAFRRTLIRDPRLAGIVNDIVVENGMHATRRRSIAMCTATTFRRRLYGTHVAIRPTSARSFSVTKIKGTRVGAHLFPQWHPLPLEQQVDAVFNARRFQPTTVASRAVCRRGVREAANGQAGASGPGRRTPAALRSLKKGRGRLTAQKHRSQLAQDPRLVQRRETKAITLSEDCRGSCRTTSPC